MEWIVLAVMYVAFLSIGHSLFQNPHLLVHSDSRVFLAQAQEPLLSRAFLLGLRPLTTAFLLKLVDVDPYWMIGIQWGLSMASWSLFAWASRTLVRSRWIALLLFGELLAMGLSQETFSWNFMVLSEAPNIALFLMLFGSVLLFADRRAQDPHLVGLREKLVLLVMLLLTVLWSHTRDPNALILMSAGALLTWLFVRRRWQWAATFAVSLVLTGVLQTAVVRASGRSEYSLVNVIGRRILPDANATNFFLQQGMPAGVVDKYRGQFAKKDFRHDFSPWLRERGTLTLLKFLATHPLDAVAAPFRNQALFLDPDLAYSGWSSPFEWNFAWARGPFLSAEVVLALATFLLLLGKRRRSNLVHPGLVVGVASVIIAVLSGLACWHADAMETARHCLMSAILLRIGLLFVLAAGLDRLAASYRGSAAISAYR